MEQDPEIIDQYIKIETFFEKLKENKIFFSIIFILVLSIFFYKSYGNTYTIILMLFSLISLILYSVFKFFSFSSYQKL